MNLNELKTITRSDNLDHLATLLVGMMFGWTNQEESVPEEQEVDEDMAPLVAVWLDSGMHIEEPFVLTEEHEDLPGISVQLSEDYEQEKDIFEFDERFGCLTKVGADDKTDLSCPYWTTSGDHPVIHDQYMLADLGSRLQNESQAPEKQFYSAAISWKHQHRMYLAWAVAIHKAKGNMPRLTKLWCAFWKVYFSKTPEQRREWLFNKQVGALKAQFEALGVKSRAAAAK